MTRRLAARTDANQTRIVHFARQVGIDVVDTSALGDGFADNVWCVGGVNVLVEIKDGDKPPSKRRLTPAEAEFHANWPGPLEIVESEDDVLRVRDKYLGT